MYDELKNPKRRETQPMTTWHMHQTGESRDCDGRYSSGHDYRAELVPVIGSNIPGTNKQMAPEDDLDLIDRALRMIWRVPDTSSVDIRIDREVTTGDDDNRYTVTGGGSTDEGYWSESFVICDRDDFNADYSGFRDHTAESMGY